MSVTFQDADGKGGRDREMSQQPDAEAEAQVDGGSAGGHENGRGGRRKTVKWKEARKRR